jgi:hypothetical protein
VTSEAGANTSDQSLDNVRKMFDAVSKELIIPGDDSKEIKSTMEYRVIDKQQLLHTY